MNEEKQFEETQECVDAVFAHSLPTLKDALEGARLLRERGEYANQEVEDFVASIVAFREETGI